MYGKDHAGCSLVSAFIVGLMTGCGPGARGNGDSPSAITSKSFAMPTSTRGGSSPDGYDTEKRELPAKADPPSPSQPMPAPDCSKPTKPSRPNILLIVADDLGYSDIHAFGGEIETPNLDALVGNGRLLTNHHSGTVSAIARSMLLSGTDHHLVGEGTMGAPSDERRGLPGYEGYLNDRSLSVAELLQDGGYHTYIAGKWHLGSGITGSNPALGKTPDQWGFERSYTLLGGAAGNHFAHEAAGSKNFTEDGAYAQPGQPGQPGGAGGTPEVFYSTDFYTQKIIQYIDSNHGDGKPFFAFAAYTSPHWPLQVPEPWLSMYHGRYDQGYDTIREARIARMKLMGVIPPWFAVNEGAPETLTQSAATPNFRTPSAKYISAVHEPIDGYVDYRGGIVNKKWNSLSDLEKKAQSRYMEIYAGMVSNLDHNIGLLIQHLKGIGEYDSTFIMFHSDNGAEGWPIDSGRDPKATDEANAADGVYQTLGTDNGSQAARRLQYGLRWAEVSATPLAQLKGSAGEGSLAVPTIVKLPKQFRRMPALTGFTHIMDEAPTFLELAGIALPTTPAPSDIDPTTGVDRNAGKVVYKDRYVYPMRGVSLVPSLSGRGNGPMRPLPLGDEAYGRACIYSQDGQWKARWTEPPFGPADGHWELFYIAIDQGEVLDLSPYLPSIRDSLFHAWQSYMTSVGGVEPLMPYGYF